MSRSFKEPIVTDYSRYNTKQMKRFASKKVRRAELSGKGGLYKKVFCSCDIHDCRSLCYAGHENEGQFDRYGRWQPSILSEQYEAECRRK